MVNRNFSPFISVWIRFVIVLTKWQNEIDEVIPRSTRNYLTLSGNKLPFDTFLFFYAPDRPEQQSDTFCNLRMRVAKLAIGCFATLDISFTDPKA